MISLKELQKILNILGLILLLTASIYFLTLWLVNREILSLVAASLTNSYIIWIIVIQVKSRVKELEERLAKDE